MTESLKFLQDEINDLKKLGETWNMDKFHVEEAIAKALEENYGIDMKKDVERSRSFVKCIVVLSFFTLLLVLLGTVAYNNSITIEVYVNNIVSDLQYPVLRRWRLLLLPLHRYFDLQSFSTEECIIDNPWYVLEVDCEACQDTNEVEIVNKIEDFNNEYYGLGPIIVTDVFPYAFKNYTIEKVMSFYEENKVNIDADSCEISTLDNTINTIADYHQLLQTSNKHLPNIRWKICYGEGLRKLRKFFPRPYFITTEGGLEKYLMIVNNSKEVLPLPTGQYANTWLAQITGISKLQIKPISDCSSTCQSFNVTLNKGEVMYLNQESWEADIVDNPSTEPATTLLSSFA